MKYAGSLEFNDSFHISMKKIQHLLIVILLLPMLLNNPVLAEGGGGDGDGGGDAGGDHDSDGHDHHHDHRHNHFYGFGGYYDPWLWGGFYGPGWGRYGYYGYNDPFYRPYYMAPPVNRIPTQPPIYIEQPKSVQQKFNYWYYCRNPEGYYPHVKECPSGWSQVAPQSN